MLLFFVFVQDGISIVEGLVLLGAMAISVMIVMRRSPGDRLETDVVEFAGSDHSLRTELIRTVLGLVGTLAGAQLLLWAAVDLADRAGLTRGFVGVTLVAVGTSLPELVTVVQSARRGEGDLILGNLLGSNLFNSLVVAGVVGLVGGAAIDAPELTVRASLAAVALGLVVWVMMHTGRRLRRAEGVVLVLVYIVVVPFIAS
jgi:cation:H+ antiporter